MKKSVSLIPILIFLALITAGCSIRQLALILKESVLPPAREYVKAPPEAEVYKPSSEILSPKETVRKFFAALMANDIETAAKYSYLGNEREESSSQLKAATLKIMSATMIMQKDYVAYSPLSEEIAGDSAYVDLLVTDKRKNQSIHSKVVLVIKENQWKIHKFITEK